MGRSAIVFASCAVPLVLHGCGGSGGPARKPTSKPTPTPTATPTPKPTAAPTPPPWVKHAGVNCARIGQDCCTQGTMKLEDCQAKCANWKNCKGITTFAAGGDVVCYPLSGVGAPKYGMPKYETGPLDLSKCSKQSGSDTWLFLPHQNVSFAFDSTVSAAAATAFDAVGAAASSTASRQLRTPRTPMSADDIVKAANVQYNQEDDGVLVHLGYWKGGNKAKNNIMSWSIINPIAENGAGRISMYLDGKRGGILANPEVAKAKHLVSCSYPCDGSTHERYYSGCGKPRAQQCDSCQGPDQHHDWCNDKLHGIPMWACNFRPNETGKMLKAYKDVKTGKSPLGPGGSLFPSCQKDPGFQQCCSSAACWASHQEEHNEAIIVPQDWDAALPDGLWAFVLPDPCFQDPSCKSYMDTYVKECETEFPGKCPPVIGMNLLDTKNPFHVISSTSAETDVVI